MKNTASIKLLFSLFLFCQFGFAQVDVVYSDLVWSDEFNTNGAVDSNKWFHQTQLPSGGSWFNGELQHYTNLITNSFVNAGMLNIVAKNESYTDQGITKQYTSARLNSKFAFKYGRVDVRAKLPIDAGTWPAIWMLGKNVNEPGGYFSSTFGTTDWPACGEIDIMEHGIFPSQSINYIQSTLHTPSSFGGSVNNGGTIASDLANSYHVYSLNWSPFQLTFLLDGVPYYTYNPAVKNASTWPFDLEQFLLLNVAMGGVAGTVPSSFTQASMQIDYVRVYQNTTVDTQAPLNFTASIGNVTSTSIELLLNATDNSGTVGYNVSYGTASNNYSGTSGVQKSIVISGLNPNTNYSFTVTASDLAGNTASNNPIFLSATTLPNSTLICSGISNLAQQGSFSTGYNYEFQTNNGNEVKITYGLLDTDKVGVVAFLWKQTPFSEVQMTNVSGNVFTHTLTNQTIGSTINYGVKFAFAGGMSVTNYYSYVVGSACSMGVAAFSELNSISFPNPVTDSININSNISIDKVEIYNLLGIKVLEQNLETDKIDVTHLQPGVYLIIMYLGSEKIVKKIIIR
ncbi:family 16 glycosylhydrolase [Flavobacterium sp.]|uniref:family 16 glycosylhydrolase n=1 Tax=Flavobacterium sp. TaxID=239 RepID=UPI0038D12992